MTDQLLRAAVLKTLITLVLWKVFAYASLLAVILSGAWLFGFL